MFEKEAEEYGLQQALWCTSESGDLKDAFRDGAEFGYNKANEWHYPDKGELPKVGAWVVGFYYGKDNWHKVCFRADGHWWGDGSLCQQPYAWKEVVPPKVK